MAELKVTQIKSTIGTKQNQRDISAHARSEGHPSDRCS